MQMATIPLIFVGGGIGYAGYQAAGLALPLTLMKFSRDFEAEADYLGLQYMYKSGYDPQAFISFFEKIQAKEKKKPGTLAKAFSSHPQTPDRIEKSQQEIEHDSAGETAIHRFDFRIRRREIAAGGDRESSQASGKKEDANKPTLRRTSSTDQNGTDNKGNNNDRPTLKRRNNDGN